MVGTIVTVVPTYEWKGKITCTLHRDFSVIHDGQSYNLNWDIVCMSQDFLKHSVCNYVSTLY